MTTTLTNVATFRRVYIINNIETSPRSLSFSISSREACLIKLEKFTRLDRLSVIEIFTTKRTMTKNPRGRGQACRRDTAEQTKRNYFL